MTCYAPLKAWRPSSNIDGGRLVFNSLKALNPDNPIGLPCGQCIGCRMDRVSQWGLRCMHESQMHSRSSFLTLTFNDEHLPSDYSVRVRDVQLFNKRLRKLMGPFRFFACGEYGDENQRPHYHALCFGHDFHQDRKLIKVTDFGPLYTSELASKAWPFGNIWIGSVTYKSASYVAGYVAKKIGGDAAASHYLRTHPNGTVHQVNPEFATQSRRPGIGATWYEKFKSDAFPSDFLVVDGQQVPVPAYYANKLTEEEFKPIQRKRAVSRRKHKQDSTPDRLEVRKTIKLERLNRLKRTL